MKGSAITKTAIYNNGYAYLILPDAESPTGYSSYMLNLSTVFGLFLLASNYTAQDILTKLLTVDGAGSGLDADKLDGDEASAFAKLSGATFTGNSKFQSGASVEISAKNGTDLPSDYPEGISSFVVGSSQTGWVITYGFVYTFKHSIVRATQLFYETGTTYRVWQRSKTDGADSWQSWRMISEWAIQSTSSTSTFTHNCDLYNTGKLTAQAASLTMAAPTGTPFDGQEFTMLIKDNGTSRSISWNAAYDSTHDTLPTQTPPGVQMSCRFKYNSTTSKWELISATWKKTIQSTTSTSTFTHDCRLYTHGKLTAQAASLTMAAPSGTATDMQEFVMYIKDNGTSRSISWNAAFSGVMAALPSSTTAGKQMVFFFVYNSTTSKWELMNTATGV